MKLLKNIKNLKNKRVLVRVDFNVALDKDGRILGDEAYKINAAIPTIKYLIDKKVKVILMTHLGRPKGFDKKLSVRPVGKYLGELLSKNIKILDISAGGGSAFGGKDIDGYWERAESESKKLKNGEMALLENLRFFPGEEKNDPKFAQELARLGDVYVDDAFGVAHRAAASNAAICRLLPAYGGLLLAEEVKVLNKLKSHPKKPFLVIMGGVKFETKLPVIQKLLPKASQILLGGALANTCLKALGYGVGASLVDDDYLAVAKKVARNKKIILPSDFILSGKNCDYQHLSLPPESRELFNASCAIYDIGPQTISEWAKVIKKAKTIIWNGPMGAFESRPFEYGTLAVGRLIASRAKGPAYGVVGGGETVAALRRTKMEEYIDFISTGGGAMLEFLAGKKLPGIEALK